MRTIWKYEIEVHDFSSNQMPAGAKILSVQFQGDVLTLWAEVESEAKKVPRFFGVFGTGHKLPREMGYKDKHIATVQHGPFVWHVYEVL